MWTIAFLRIFLFSTPRHGTIAMSRLPSPFLRCVQLERETLCWHCSMCWWTPLELPIYSLIITLSHCLSLSLSSHTHTQPPTLTFMCSKTTKWKKKTDSASQSVTKVWPSLSCFNTSTVLFKGIVHQKWNVCHHILTPCCSKPVQLFVFDELSLYGDVTQDYPNKHIWLSYSATPFICITKGTSAFQTKEI